MFHFACKAVKCFFSLLKGAELLHLGKRLKPQFGGGLKEFVYEDAECFLGVENRNQFLSSQERASIVLCFLEGIRAGHAEYCGSLKFRDGQAIRKLVIIMGGAPWNVAGLSGPSDKCELDVSFGGFYDPNCIV